MSNRYSPSFSIAEAINVIAGRKNEETKKLTHNLKNHSPKKEHLKELVKSGQKENLDEINSNKESITKITESTLTKSTWKKDSLEKELPEKLSLPEKKDFKVNYSPEAEFLLNGIYNPNPLDYVKLFYGGLKSNVLGNPYAKDTTKNSADSDAEQKLISNRQVENTAIKIQYSAALGNFEAVSFRERENYSHWVKFNPVLMRMFESIHGLTSDLNYDKLF